VIGRVELKRSVESCWSNMLRRRERRWSNGRRCKVRMRRGKRQRRRPLHFDRLSRMQRCVSGAERVERLLMSPQGVEVAIENGLLG
jgi:hypothetical protein